MAWQNRAGSGAANQSGGRVWGRPNKGAEGEGGGTRGRVGGGMRNVAGAGGEGHDGGG